LKNLHEMGFENEVAETVDALTNAMAKKTTLCAQFAVWRRIENRAARPQTRRELEIVASRGAQTAQVVVTLGFDLPQT